SAADTAGIPRGRGLPRSLADPGLQPLHCARDRHAVRHAPAGPGGGHRVLAAVQLRSRDAHHRREPVPPRQSAPDPAGNAGADAGGRQEDPGRAATPSGSGADGGALPQPATLPALRGSTSAEGHAPSAADVAVWRRGGSCTRFGPCRCGVASRRTITPAAEIMPDRCTPEYERTFAKMGALLPYRRARSLLEEFFPLGHAPEVQTIRQQTMRVGARLERDAVAPPTSSPSSEAESIALAIDGGVLRGLETYVSGQSGLI